MFYLQGDHRAYPLKRGCPAGGSASMRSNVFSWLLVKQTGVISWLSSVDIFY